MVFVAQHFFRGIKKDIAAGVKVLKYRIVTWALTVKCVNAMEFR